MPTRKPSELPKEVSLNPTRRNLIEPRNNNAMTGEHIYGWHLRQFAIHGCGVWPENMHVDEPIRPGITIRSDHLELRKNKPLSN